MTKYSFKPQSEGRSGSKFLSLSFLEQAYPPASLPKQRFFQPGTIPSYALAALLVVGSSYGYQYLEAMAKDAASSTSQKTTFENEDNLKAAPSVEGKARTK